MLGVVENMSGLRVPASAVRFSAPDGRGGEADVTEAALAALAAVAPGLVASADVFAPTRGGAERVRPAPKTCSVTVCCLGAHKSAKL